MKKNKKILILYNLLSDLPMKKLFSILMLILVCTFTSCSDPDPNIDDTERYEPKQLKLKSVSKQWNENYSMKSEDTYFYYDENGLLSTTENLFILKYAEERTTSNYHYTKTFLDSISTLREYKSYTNGSSVSTYRSKYYFTHNSEGLITDREGWADNEKISHTRYFYEDGDLIRYEIYYTPSPPNKPYTTVHDVSIVNGNPVEVSKSRYAYDNYNNIYKNVYSQSYQIVLNNGVNNPISMKYNVIQEQKYNYTYNKDNFPETRETFEVSIGAVVTTEKFSYY